MMTSEEMTERVLERLDRHRQKIDRRNAIVKKLTFGLLGENTKGVNHMNTRGILALTASVALIAAASVAAISLNMGISEPDSELSEPATEMTTTIISTNIEPTTYHELELHEETKRIYSMDEEHANIQTAYAEYKLNGAWIIDRDKYIPLLHDEELRNSPDAKSYIYHMMLNSVDYFKTARGSLNMADEVIDFAVDIPGNYSYENMNTSILYRLGEISYTINTGDMTCRKFYGCTSEGMSMSDNDRLVTLSDDGYDCSVNRNDLAYVGVSGSGCLLPQGIAFSRLSDFGNWEIVGTENIIGYDCAVIEGELSESPFRVCVDMAHGILMRFEENGVTEYETTALELDTEIGQYVFNPDGYTEINQNGCSEEYYGEKINIE